MTTELAVAPSNAFQSKKCFANLHMRPEEYALWDVSRSLSHATGILYFDGRAMAAHFKGTSKSRMYRLAKRLLDEGWYELLAPSVRDKRTGLFSSTQYGVLSAEEWAQRYPHVCLAESSHQNGTGAGPDCGNPADKYGGRRQHPVLKMGMTSPQNGTYSAEENSVKENRKIDTADPLSAARAAYNLFCREGYGDMDPEEQTAFQMIVWTLYRAVAAGQIPRTAAYYIESRDNFLEQNVGWYNILETAEDKFHKHAADFVHARCPDLTRWLHEKACEMEPC